MKYKDLILSDDTLFHFTDRITFLEKILPSNLFLLNHLRNTNDPQEYKEYDFQLSTLVSTADLILLSKVHDEINDYFRNFVQIGCFCIKKKNELKNTWQKPKLWTDFGDGHRGFCLMISKSSIILELEKQKYYHDIKEVSYKFNQISLPNPDLNLYQKIGSRRYCNQFVKENISIVRDKDLDYKNENESRCYAISENSNRIELNLKNILKGLIIGDRCPSIYNDLILQHCKYLDIYKLNFQAGVGYKVI